MVVVVLTILISINGLILMGMIRKHKQMQLMMLAYLEDLYLRGGKLPNQLPTWKKK